MTQKHSLRFFSFFILFIFTQIGLQAQTAFEHSDFRNARIMVDTMQFTWRDNALTANQKRKLPFRYTKETEVAEVFLNFDKHTGITGISLVPSGDFFQMDSLMIFGDYARFKVQFSQLTNSEFLKFTFKVSKDTMTQFVDLPLFPFTETYVEFYPGVEELYIGEEKVFEITTNNNENLIIDNRWTEGLPINYRLDRDGGKLLLFLLPTELGDQMISVPFKLNKPYLSHGVPQYHLPLVNYSFKIRSGRLAFLQFDRNEVTPKDDRKAPIEIQIDNSSALRLGRTYRIEDQEESGGALIAELYTKARLNNDKVLCLLRSYAYHRKSEGYLYIKDGDEARFVCNLDITPKTNISGIFIQREGKDWERSTAVYPGETINVRLEGEGLHKANFSFPGASNLEYDSLVKNENASLFRLKVPLTINTPSIEIYNHNRATGKSLIVKEFERPRQFDFISLDFGEKQFVLDDIEKPIYYEKTITDLVINFNQHKIDEGKDLYGRQYVNIKVKISNKSGNLIELYQFDDLVICPGETSPRFTHYDSKNCQRDDINLNNFLSKKTYDLEEWSRIELEISHDKEKYGGQGRTKKIRIHLKRDYNFDIDVSFPAGLLILKPGDENFSNFGGPSFAMIAQMGFYQPGKIAKYQPYKIGAGFIAMDAFNFTGNSSNRDVGLVVIGSLYPTSSDNRLSFPLYAGFGYMMVDQRMFFLIGPGIRVRL